MQECIFARRITPAEINFPVEKSAEIIVAL